MKRSIVAAVFVTAGIVTQTLAQCPNQVANLNYNSRTMTANDTWFILPISKTAVKKAVLEAYGLSLLNTLGLDLLPVPPELGIPSDMHPVLVTAGLANDIRQMSFQLPEPLMGATTIVPFVRKGTSLTPLNAPLIAYLAGTGAASEQYLAALIPTLVSSLVGGIPSRIGKFLPDKSSYQSNNNGLFSINSKLALLPPPPSGPIPYPEAIDMIFRSASSPRYTLQQWKSVINQPYILNNINGANPLLTGKCQRNTYYFDNATAQPQERVGDVVLGPAASVDRTVPLVDRPSGTLQMASADGLGTFRDVVGLSACAQLVGYDSVVAQGEDCDVAYDKVKAAGDV